MRGRLFKNITVMSKQIKRLLSWAAALAGILAGIGVTYAHSVGQIQTTKFFAPETVQALQDRVNAGGSAGFQVGDILTYIIQFTPVANGATVGVHGYITDYIPPGVEVVGADIVQKIGDSYSPVSPSLPGGIDTGWDGRGQNTYLSPFNTSSYDTTGLCAAFGYNANCNGRLTEVYADTGIFFSTDPRTSVFPTLPTRIVQGLNGYNISPTAENKLNGIIGQSNGTTHNLWDADQTNAFGTKDQATVNGIPAPKSTAAYLGGGGQGLAPFRAGSAVAGAQTGYSLDNTAQIGPWQRIAYPGSRIGDPSIGPATGLGASTTAVGGLPTSLGRSLSESNPLPSGTNAVRWAVGKLVVGEISYVRIKLRVTQPVPTEGITNASEVFGGDAGDGDDGKDSTWRYHIPSVADTNSNLYIYKQACKPDPTATTCIPLQGGYHAGDTTITYQITYLNTGNLAQSNVVLSDVLPCQTTAAATRVLVGAVTGPLAALISVPWNTTTAANGVCGTTPTRQTIAFPTLSSLASGAGGRLIINVRNTATTLNEAVVNTARLASVALPSGITSNAVTFVGDNSTPALAVQKTTPSPTSTAGGTAQYVIVITNIGTGTATGIVVSDLLPSNGDDVVNANTRFNFGSVSAISSTGLTTSTALVTSTSTVAAGGLTPYNTQPGALNKVQANFNFGAASTLVPNGVITLTFVANVGSVVNASATPYYNNLAVRTGAATVAADSGDAAPVTIGGALQITKELECYFVGSSCIAANSSATIPSNSRVRYRINYANVGGGALSNVVLTETLPCQTTNGTSVTVTAVLSGPIAPTSTTPYAVTSPVAGTCPSTRRSFPFPAATLNAGQTGSLQIDVQLSTPSNTSSVVVNDVSISNGTVTASAQNQSNVLNQANLILSKSASPSMAPPGSTVTFTLLIANIGTAAAQTITLADILPTGTSLVADVTRRFSFVGGSSVFAGALSSVATTTQTPPTITPYNAGTYAANQEQITWNFGAQTLAVGATASISFQSLIGSALPPLIAPNYYYNNAVVTYSNGQRAAANAASASVSLVANLSISKTNGTTTLASGATTVYTIVASNGGPSAAHGAILRDVAGAGLLCDQVTCSATSGGASCPAGFTLGTPVASGSTTLFSTGVAITTFPANSSATLLVRCSVQASGF
jgi:uncharacterized repeat protein (TIGR01451 family)